MKFGGTSVGGAAAIRQMLEVVRGQLARGPVVVVSAHAGVTDALLSVAQSAGDDDARLDAIVARHRQILAGLGLDEHLLDVELAQLRDAVRATRLLGEATAKVTDLIISYGERLSARVVAAALTKGGVAATAVDAFRAGMLTDSSFGRARPLPDRGRISRYLETVNGVPVVTGFLGADQGGNITTLGRNGSDYSAALIGAAIGAEEIQIWKDVDGVHTADPRLVPDAQSIPAMGFEDLANLASFGAKVLHPAAMVPAMQSGIRLTVRNTLSPDAPGTQIEAARRDGLPAIRAIAHRASVALVTVRSHRLLPQHAFLARVFARLDEVACEVSPVAVGVAAVTVAIDDASAERVAASLANLGDVRITPERAVVGVIGDAAALEGDGIADALQEMANAGISVRCAGLGALGSTASFVVDASRLTEAVRLLHDRFFPARADMCLSSCDA